MTSSAAPPPGPSRQTIRIQRDLQALQDKPLPFVLDLQLSTAANLKPDGNQLTSNQLSGILVGPENSPYAGGHFRFVITFPPEYPFKPPDFIFSTGICHPNVDSRTGVACHDQLLATWAPSITLTNLLTEMRSLLATPNHGTPIEGDTLTDKTQEKAREWTQLSAQPQK